MVESTLGFDIEFFLMSRNEDGLKRIIPADWVYQGGKKERERLPNGATFHRDNVSLELQSRPVLLGIPGEANDLLKEDVAAMLTRARELWKEREVDGWMDMLELSNFEAIFLPNSTVKESEYLDEFGCDPDRCAYSGGALMPGPDPRKCDAVHQWRCASGHIHLVHQDIQEWNREDVCRYIHFMDLYVGLPLTLMAEKSSDTSRQMYGQAGRFRLKRYTIRNWGLQDQQVRGVEYRTPSSGWVHRILEKKDWYMDLIHSGVDMALEETRRKHTIDPAISLMVRNAINSRTDLLDVCMVAVDAASPFQLEDGGREAWMRFKEAAMHGYFPQMD